MKKILILLDKRKYLSTSLRNKEKMVDYNIIRKNLEKKGVEVEIKSLHELIFPTKYDKWYVIFPSSEDAGLFYKEYIEDILLRLQLDGAILLPRFEMFRAHHNKVFMESYRTLLSQEYNTIHSFSFYGIDDLKRKLNSEIIYPVILKTSSGAGSSGVAIANNKVETIAKARKMSKITFYGCYFTRKRGIKSIIRRTIRFMTGQLGLEAPRIQEKMICQSFVANLSCDYKVLVFGEKYYLLRRKTKKNDFRASGSGLLEFPNEFTETEKEILNYSRVAYKQLNTPLLSIDIAFDGNTCHMIEFQTLNFGPYTLQFSNCYYKYKSSGDWSRIFEESILEEEMANAYIYYITTIISYM